MQHAGHVKRIVSFGQTAPKFKAIAEKLNIPYDVTDNPYTGIELIHRYAVRGDTVLFSRHVRAGISIKITSAAGSLSRKACTS